MKFCSKCGEQLEDAQTFCASCGAEQETNVVTSMEQEVKDEQAPVPVEQGPIGQASPSYNALPTIEPTNKKNTYIGIAAIVVIAILAVMGVKNLFFAGNPEKVADEFMTAMFDGDADKLVDCIAHSNEYEEDVKGAELSELKDAFSMIGESVELTHEVTDSEKLSKSDLKEFWKDNEYGRQVYVEEKSVKKMYKCTVKINIKAEFMGKTVDESEEMKLYIGKVKGKYKVLTAQQ